MAPAREDMIWRRELAADRSWAHHMTASAGGSVTRLVIPTSDSRFALLMIMMMALICVAVMIRLVSREPMKRRVDKCRCDDHDRARRNHLPAYNPSEHLPLRPRQAYPERRLW